MVNPVLTYVSKLARKLVMAVLIAVLALITYSLWLFVQEHADYEERRARLIATTEGERQTLQTQLDKQKTRHQAAVQAVETQRLRMLQAEKVLKSLHDLDPGTLERIFGDREQKAIHDDKIERTGALKTEAETRMVESQREVVSADQARTELARQLSEVQREERALKEERFAIQHYLRRAWHDARVLIIAVFAVYLFGGLAGSTLGYFLWAPWITRRVKPVQLPPGGSAAPTVGPSGVVAEDAVWPGEVLWVKKKFLQASDAGLTRRSRLMLNWRTPLSCAAVGLTRLVELRNGRSDGERRVVFANADDHFAELVVLAIPEGGAFVLRAGFLHGIIAGLDQPPVIRRHWRIFSWQSWVTGQFGYFEFAGRCRLIVSCVSTVTAQTMVARDDGKPTTLRTQQAGVIGLSPRLEFKPVRSEGFWRYCQSESPLFDLHLTGEGVVLSRDPQGRGRDGFRAQLLKFWGL